MESPHLFQLSQSPVVKKRRKVQEKFTKKDAVEIMDKIGEYAETAQYLLESMGDRTFSDLDGKDLEEFKRKEKALRTRLGKLDKAMKDRKFQYKLSKDPSLLEVTFCKKEEFSFLENLQPYANSEDSDSSQPNSAEVLPAVEPESQSNVVASDPPFRKS